MATTLDFIEGLQEGCYQIVLNNNFELFFSNHSLHVSEIKTARAHYTKKVLVMHYSSDKLGDKNWRCETRTGLPVIVPYNAIRFLRRQDDL